MRATAGRDEIAAARLAQIGLVLLMFQIGLEFEFGSVYRAGKASIAAVDPTP